MPSRNSDDPLNEYDFRGAQRGKYANRYAQGTNVFVLAPDVVEAFPSAGAVNSALRSLIRLQEELENVKASDT